MLAGKCIDVFARQSCIGWNMVGPEDMYIGCAIKLSMVCFRLQ